MAQQIDRLPHKLTLNRREQLTVTGVDEIIGFDENTVVLQTELGMLYVHGEGLQVYREPRIRRSLFGRGKA